MSDEQFSIRNTDFTTAGFPRPFTMDERSILKDVYDKEGVDEVQRQAVDAAVGPPTAATKAREQLERQFRRAIMQPWEKYDQGRVEGTIARLVKVGGFESDYRTSVVARLDGMLSEEYVKDFDDWDDERIEAINDALASQQALLEQVRTKDLSHQLQLAEERQEAMEGVLEVMDRANMVVAYEIGKHNHLSVNGFKRWMKHAKDEDYQAADRLVQEGKRFASLERRMRRQASEQVIPSSASEPTPPEGVPEAT